MRSIFAIARNTISQALRLKVAVIIVVLLLILLPLMSMVMVGDETLKGKLQTFTSYGLSLTSLLLCLLTIIVSTYTLSSDLKYKQLHLVVTKPVHRFQVVCGKLLGVVLLDVLLLAVFASIIYGLTSMMPRMADVDEGELLSAQKEFFTARGSLVGEVDEAEVSRMAQEAYDKLEQQGLLPENSTKRQILRVLHKQNRLKARAVEAGAEKKWEFTGVRKLADGESLFVQYKFQVGVVPDNERVYGVWLVGDIRQRDLGLELKNPIYVLERSDAISVVHEFEVPANAITDDGYLAVVLKNPIQNQTTLIPEEVKVLFKAGTFGGNFARAALMILARLIFLAALGVSVSTWLSFPVAILVCLTVFLTGTVNGFIVESIGGLGQGASIIYGLTIKPLLWLLPRFDGEFNPTRFMVAANLLEWSFLLRIYAVLVLGKSLLLTLFGVWVFSNREIAKITV